MSLTRQRIVLLGAGHAHVELLRHGDLTSVADEVVLVTPGDFWYSGLATGVAAGLYPRDLDRVSVDELASDRRIRVVRDRVISGDPDRRRLRLATGDTLSYDVLSVNLGSRTRRAFEGADDPIVTPVKPLHGLLELPERLRSGRGGSPTTNVVVIGGGASGCEVALAVQAAGVREGLRARITLVTGGELLASFPSGARRSLRSTFRARGLELLERTAVTEVADGQVVTENGRLSADLVVNATGLEPVPEVARLGFPVDEQGALRVDRTLRSPADDRVFGAGDCISIEDRPLARVGVHAVRQAPVLAKNIRAVVQGGRSAVFEPQRRYLLILNLGDGTGLATWGPFHWKGRSAFVLKDWLDRRFLEGRGPVPRLLGGG